MRKTLLVLSVLAFLVSLPLPALVLTNAETEKVWHGWAALVFGWVGFLVKCPAWLANPVYALGVVWAWRRPASRAVCWLLLLAGVLGLSTATMAWSGVPMDESGRPEAWGQVRPAVGAYLWLTALLLAAVAAWRRESEGRDLYLPLD